MTVTWNGRRIQHAAHFIFISQGNPAISHRSLTYKCPSTIEMAYARNQNYVPTISRLSYNVCRNWHRNEVLWVAPCKKTCLSTRFHQLSMDWLFWTLHADQTGSFFQNASKYCPHSYYGACDGHGNRLSLNLWAVTPETAELQLFPIEWVCEAQHGSTSTTFKVLAMEKKCKCHVQSAAPQRGMSIRMLPLILKCPSLVLQMVIACSPDFSRPPNIRCHNLWWARLLSSHPWWSCNHLIPWIHWQSSKRRKFWASTNKKRDSKWCAWNMQHHQTRKSSRSPSYTALEPGNMLSKWHKLVNFHCDMKSIRGCISPIYLNILSCRAISFSIILYAQICFCWTTLKNEPSGSFDRAALIYRVGFFSAVSRPSMQKVVAAPAFSAWNDKIMSSIWQWQIPSKYHQNTIKIPSKYLIPKNVWIMLCDDKFHNPSIIGVLPCVRLKKRLHWASDRD